jgi:hypothetical protein
MHKEAACSPFGMKSTASLPFSPQSLDGLSGHVEFKRMVSGGASTCMPSPDFDCFERQVSEATEDGFNLPASQLEALHLGGFCSTSDSDEEDYYLDDDGAMWIETTVRHDVGLQSKEDHLCTKTVGVNYTEILEDKLAQVKCLYHARFGEDFESEDTTYDSQLQKLQGSLYEVTALFQQKYGLHVDNLDNDGCAWIKMAGSCCMETLEEKLAEVKCLYHDKFSKDAESEDETYGSQLQRCQDSLCELEALFAQKYGHDIDDVDEDGCVWINTGGCSSMDTLEVKLAEVKCLYHDKFGTAVDETYDSQLQRSLDSLCELEALFAQKYGHAVNDLDEDGCVWVKTVGDEHVCGITELQPLQVALDTVKSLFRNKYGHDVDDEIFTGCCGCSKPSEV